jgi:hypothetical protein
VLDRLSNLLNRVNDWDLTWVGFQALRPAPERNMTARVLLTLCLVYCPIAAVAGFVSAYVILGTRAPTHVPWVVAGGAAVAFFVLQSVFAWAWNRRAARLRAGARSDVGA